MNRLARERSLYLRQHAHNPVDWYPWGPEALAAARQLDRPIFLSVGYSACHWCHVMERESFESPEVAAILNEQFVCVKVDREERPEIDHLYMTALQVMTREGGGWPLSVWLTPELHPFYAGTYFPPDDRHAPHRPSFPALLRGIATAWQTRRGEIVARSGEIAQFLREADASAPAAALSPTLLKSALAAAQRGYDAEHGGFGREPKFPHALQLRLLMRLAGRFAAASAGKLVAHSLDRMAMGGIFDHVGGGFHRYSTDRLWRVPHFEKMLYDNALLASTYAESWQASRNPLHRDIARETLDYALREMALLGGPFACAQDADTDGEEGKFYLWTAEEIAAALPPEQTRLVEAAYGVTPEGNFEGRTILHRTQYWEAIARGLGISEADLRAGLSAALDALREARMQRTPPGRDEKVLTSWNGLMIAALSRAGAAFGEPRYLAAARQAAEWLLANAREADGRLQHRPGAGDSPAIPGFCEDYAYLLEGLLELHQATQEARWLRVAVELADHLLADFAAPQGGFYFTAAGHESLVVRSRDHYDGSTPSGNGMAATVLTRLAHLTQQERFRVAARGTLQAFAGSMNESPGGASQLLMAYHHQLGPQREWVLIAPRASAEAEEIRQALARRFEPCGVVIAHDPSEAVEPLLAPHLGSRSMVEGRPTLYVCTNQTCEAPHVGAEAILARIADESR